MNSVLRLRDKRASFNEMLDFWALGALGQRSGAWL
jgi:hypothetical protein